MKWIFAVFLSCVGAASAAPLAQDQIVQLDGHDIVILGEVHDNRVHHEGQGQAIIAIAPKAVVFEMLSPEQAKIVNDPANTDAAELDVKLNWADSSWPPFELYLPVFKALGEAQAVGAAMPRDQVRAAFGEGAAAIFGPEAAGFGLDQLVPADQLDTRKQMQFDAHCAAMSLETMGGMVEAQRLRDAHFARVALAPLRAHGAPIVVIGGNGHARVDWGMPAYLKTAAPEISVFAVGFVEDPVTADNPRFDLTLPTAPAERGDPCDIFKKK